MSGRRHFCLSICSSELIIVCNFGVAVALVMTAALVYHIEILIFYSIYVRCLMHSMRIFAITWPNGNAVCL